MHKARSLAFILVSAIGVMAIPAGAVPARNHSMTHESTVTGQGEGPLLLQQPTLSATQIAFVYAGDLWIVDREGGDARRLTSHPGRETDPYFSPDGTLIAFTGEYDGNVDVYVVPAKGGVPR